MKELSIYISTLLLICQFSVDAMDVGPNGGFERGGDDFCEVQLGRLSPVPMN